jgi:glycine oxidase
MWAAFAAEIEEASGRAIGLRVDGKLAVAHTPAQWEAFSGRMRQYENAHGLAMLSAADAHAMEPLLRADIAGAWWDPNEAQVDNRALCPALARAFVNAGGTLQLDETAIRIEHGKSAPHRIGISTPFRSHWSDAVVMAAGAWTARIEGLPAEIVPPIVPVKGEMIALAPQGELPKHIVAGDEIYLVPRHDRLFVGATVSRDGIDTRLSDDAKEWLAARAFAVMPALAAWPIVDHWAGLRPGSPDDLPLLGHAGLEGLYIASGQFRNGILFAPAIADAMSDLVLGRESRLNIDAFDPRRFRAGPR